MERSRSHVYRFQLDGSPATALASHGDRVGAVALSSDATLVASASVDGTIRIGPISGEEPHLFFGHEGVVWTLAFSPDGRWLASGGADGTVRLWPVPDRTKTASQAWSRDRFLSMLRQQTNLRVIPDAASATGFRLERGRFVGWEHPPEPY
jgi:WD40 repeat protein